MNSISSIDHIRSRPGMYIGKLGDGKYSDDGIYTMVDIALWNALNCASKRIELDVKDKLITVRCYDDAPKEWKCDNRYRSYELVWVKALSSKFSISSMMNGQCKKHQYEEGKEVSICVFNVSEKENYTELSYIADETILGSYSYNFEYIKELLNEFVSINSDVNVTCNGESYFSENGILDLLNNSLLESALYSPIHFKDEIVDIAFTHTINSGAKRYFANGKRAEGGGDLVYGFCRGLTKVLNEIFDTKYKSSDVCKCINCAVSIRLEEAQIYSEIKNALSSKNVREGLTIVDFLKTFLRAKITKYFAEHADVAEYIRILLTKQNCE